MNNRTISDSKNRKAKADRLFNKWQSLRKPGAEGEATFGDMNSTLIARLFGAMENRDEFLNLFEEKLESLNDRF